MKTKMKSGLVVALGMLGIVMMLAGVMGRFRPEKAKDNWQPEESAPVEAVTVRPEKPADATASASVEIPVESEPEPTKESSKKPTKESVKPIETEQKIQPDPVKPEPPTETELQDVSKPPVIEEKPTTPQKPTTPKGGTEKDGMVYIDGFGWIEDHGGGGIGETVPNMFENGNKIGEM